MKYVYVGNTPTLGYENTFCTSCQKLLIELTGFTVDKNFVYTGKCTFCHADIPGVW
jgi:pyruvate formate lyase activating enzyme